LMAFSTISGLEAETHFYQHHPQCTTEHELTLQL
jgi:hypothetical protein